MARRSAPEVNAGSMADIAFLLLIFFLVTTTIEVDSGIASKLPPPLPEDTPPPPIKEKNIFQVIVNAENRLLVEEEDMDIKNLTNAAIAFLDNGGGTDPRNACTYCRGAKDPESSDNPKKAIISLVNDRQASYKMYLAVTNELVRAYATLRDREAKRLYNETFSSMTNRYSEWPATEKESPEYLELEERIKKVRELFPRNLSEAEPQNRE
ncbi:biopolymer transporter ExbD [Nonlabens dokdonensis]|uniref:Biopolymer transporter ExbD n=1 Tax=Nonlabens dokdonensis TaxID=328515 RepID=A0A1Z8AZ01_9FLAO|nr:biopolymer transporter ExbD [Nonlabens dokdonensis]OUS15555.1 biopolymer transporter ExbD [Nonlabens dokdonensis]